MNSQEFKVSKLSFQALRNDQTQVEWTEHVNQSPSAEKAPYFPVPVGKGCTLRVTAYGQGAYDGETLKPGAIAVPYDKPNIEVKADENPPPEVKVDEAFGELDGDKVVGELNGENLKMVEGDTLSFTVTHGGATEAGEATVVESTDSKITYEIGGASAGWAGGEMTLTLKSRAGDPTLPFQTVEKSFAIA